MERKIDRFDKYVNFRGLNSNRVTREAQLSIGTLGKSRKEGKDLSNKSIEKILKCYLELNRKWLLYGEGDMLTDGGSVLLEDSPSQYGICKECADKEKEIIKLKNRITFLTENIREYKKENSEKDQQIGRLKSILEQNGIVTF